MTTITTILGDRLLIRRKPAEPTSAIVAVPGADDREQPFFATVVAVAWTLTEPIKPGDTVLCAAPPSQDRVGTRAVLWQGEPAELMSTLDVVGIVTP